MHLPKPFLLKLTSILNTPCLYLQNTPIYAQHFGGFTLADTKYTEPREYRFLPIFISLSKPLRKCAYWALIWQLCLVCDPIPLVIHFLKAVCDIHKYIPTCIHMLHLTDEVETCGIRTRVSQPAYRNKPATAELWSHLSFMKLPR